MACAPRWFATLAAGGQAVIASRGVALERVRVDECPDEFLWFSADSVGPPIELAELSPEAAATAAGAVGSAS